MKPQYNTWLVSSHSQIACAECHIPSGIKNSFKTRIESLTKVYLHFSKGFFLPIQVAEEIKSERCFECHSMQRQFSASGDIKIPHDKHMKKEVNCLECHAGIVHTKIAQRLETIDGDFTRWNQVMAKGQIKPENKMLSMNQCLNCHSLQKVQTKCEDCHSQIHFPETHKNQNWVNQHGIDAKKDIESCDKCHSYTSMFSLEDIQKSQNSFTKPASKLEGSTSIKVIDYARTNTLCFSCHRKKPINHERSWRLNHPIKAKMDSSGCLVCHDYSSKKIVNSPLPIDQQNQKFIKDQNLTKYNNFNPASTTCNRCHFNKHQNFQRETHPIRLPPETKVNNSCSRCHDSSVCSRCHFFGK